MNESILPIAVLKIADGFHMIVTIKIEGHKARMIVDTAASRTVFDKKRILKMIKQPVVTNNYEAGTTAAGAIEQQQTQIKELKLDNTIIEDYDATLVDLKDLNNTYKQHKLQPIDGLIGADILVKHKAIIDIETKELIF